MKKQLLNESEVRKLMKFANLGALSENFVQDLEEEDETTPAGLEEVGQPLEDPDAMTSPDDMPMDDQGAEDVEDVEDVEAVDTGDEGVTAEVTIGTEEATALIGLLDQLKDAVDVPGEADEAGEEMALGSEEDPLVADEEPTMTAESVEEAELEEDLEKGNVQLYEDDEVVNEVTRRVAKRLLAAKRQT